jgi:hypothetical protein
VTNLSWMSWAITRYFRNQGLEAHLRPIRLGNAIIDGEITGRDCRIALELKTPNDDVVRGIGQLSEALAYSYDRATLVTTMRNARRIKTRVFRKLGITLLGVDSNGTVHQVCPEISEPN